MQPFNTLAELLDAIGVKTKRRFDTMDNLDRVLLGKPIKPVKEVRHCQWCKELAHKLREECRFYGSGVGGNETN